MNIKTACFAAALVPFPVLADEAWTTPFGNVIYEKDIGDTAIFFTDYRGDDTRLYFPGLAGQLDDRGSHQGYWITSGDGPCSAELAGPDGTSSNDWGRMMITFDNSTFPSGWTAIVGTCFSEFEAGVRAEVK